MSKSLIVIGGGINGVAIALDAVQLGYAVTLIEKLTVGSGTSSKTSKLAHGGLRYLQQFQFKVVRESVQERNRLLETYPDFVHPLKFVVPVYNSSPWGMLTLSLGLTVYDLFSGLGSPLPWHRRLSAEEITADYPDLVSRDLKGGFSYYDAQLDDLGLVRHMADEARQRGVCVLENHQCIGLEYHHGHVCGVRIRHDHMERVLLADQVIQTAGPWSSMFLEQDDPDGEFSLTLSKGAHIVVPDIGYSDAFLLSAPQDQRVFFVMPFNGHTLIGTTETIYHGHPDSVVADDGDIDYLRTAFLSYFPRFADSPILDSFAGLRPLITQRGASMSPGIMSRDFRLVRSSSGLYSVLGGKYTTHGAVARYVVRCLNSAL
jgi:glycerol-3-phosphate dehydrogenase